MDTNQEHENQNAKTKSEILAPFNSSLKYEITSFEDGLKIENEALKFVGKVREANRQYELNNNGEIDNGILINNAIPPDEKEGKIWNCLKFLEQPLKMDKQKMKIMSNPVSPSPELNLDKVSGLSSPHEQNRNKKNNNSQGESGLLIGKLIALT